VDNSINNFEQANGTKSARELAISSLWHNSHTAIYPNFDNTNTSKNAHVSGSRALFQIDTSSDTAKE
jgi:hypothetical protein